MVMNPRDQGALNFHAGLAAEECVARQYRTQGAKVAATRWRGKNGEIDLVVTDGKETVFVEVKRARNFVRAAQSLGSRQIRRICDAALEYVDRLPMGTLTPMRFDVALVDASGRVRIIPNAFGSW